MIVMIQNILLSFRRNMLFSVLSGVLLTILLCLSAISPVLAQTTTSTIIGHISDGKNPIPDAVVTVVHEPTGQHYYVFTNQRGNYVINNILVGGPYTVRVERLNHKTALIHNVEAPLGETVVVDGTHKVMPGQAVKPIPVKDPAPPAAKPAAPAVKK